MKKKSIFVLLGIMVVLVGGGYYLHTPQETEVELEEVCDSIGYEDSLDIVPLDTLSVVDEFFDKDKWRLDTLCRVDGKFVYAGRDRYGRTSVVFDDKRLFVEVPMLDYPNPKMVEEFVESCKISTMGKTLLVDFSDSTSIAQLSALGKIHPEFTRYRKDTLAVCADTVKFFITADFLNSSHEKAKEIEKWMMNLGYRDMLRDTTTVIVKDKNAWWNILSRRVLQDLCFDESNYSVPIVLYHSIDLHAHILTDKFVTYQKYTSYYTGGMHGYNKECLNSFDFIHQENVDWNYLFKEQYNEKVWDLLTEVAFEDEKYKNSHVDYDLEDVRIQLQGDGVDLGLGDEGVVFSYQPYEIGSFADGTFHFTISYEKLKPYLTDKAKWCLE